MPCSLALLHCISNLSVSRYRIDGKLTNFTDPDIHLPLLPLLILLVLLIVLLLLLALLILLLLLHILLPRPPLLLLPLQLHELVGHHLPGLFLPDRIGDFAVARHDFCARLTDRALPEVAAGVVAEIRELLDHPRNVRFGGGDAGPVLDAFDVLGVGRDPCGLLEGGQGVVSVSVIHRCG